jgi:hypothetical protein
VDYNVHVRVKPVAKTFLALAQRGRAKCAMSWYTPLVADVFQAVRAIEKLLG